MPTVDGIRVDAVRLVPDTEWDPRTRRITTLQVHHATMSSLSGLEALMAPGGRTVSANIALGTDGTKVLKVPVHGRAYTSASAFDHESFTVETCNTSYDPDWGISRESHEALAELLLDLHDRFGVALKVGIGGVIGHSNVPGTYATACPGPSMNLAWIVDRAKQLKQEREDAEDMPTPDEIAAAVWKHALENRLRGAGKKNAAGSLFEAVYEDVSKLRDAKDVRAQVVDALTDPDVIAALRTAINSENNLPE